MTIPGTNCIFEFKIQHFYGDPPEMRTLTIDVRERSSDRIYSQFDFEGTEAEFIEYVRKPGYDCDDFYKRIIHLADRASQDD